MVSGAPTCRILAQYDKYMANGYPDSEDEPLVHEEETRCAAEKEKEERAYHIYLSLSSLFVVIRYSTFKFVFDTENRPMRISKYFYFQIIFCYFPKKVISQK